MVCKKDNHEFIKAGETEPRVGYWEEGKERKTYVEEHRASIIMMCKKCGKVINIDKDLGLTEEGIERLYKKQEKERKRQEKEKEQDAREARKIMKEIMGLEKGNKKNRARRKGILK